MVIYQTKLLFDVEALNFIRIDVGGNQSYVTPDLAFWVDGEVELEVIIRKRRPEWLLG